MAHSLSSISATASTTLSSSPKLSNKPPSYPRFLSIQARSNAYNEAPDNYLISRRNVALVITGAMLGLNAADRSAEAASRRPPPPPPQEKKDPNVSGLQAKLLASKRRKEAMEEAIAKLREKGKLINQPPPE